MKHFFDYIIVGAGTAGCVVARRLLERTEATVLLVEAGPPYAALFLDPPLPGMKVGRRYSWRQRSTPQQRLGNRVIEWPMGKVVGGSSSVNAMMGFRGQPADFDAWEDAGNHGWSSHALAPYFQRVFASQPGTPLSGREHGVLSLSSPRFHSSFSEAFLAACEQDGMMREHPLSGRADGCCGYFPVLQRNGVRFESANAYLQPVKRHRNLTLQTGMHVRRVLLKKNRAVGIEVTWRRQPAEFRATEGVILCGGSFQTPRLLQCSGIGPSEVLKAAQIPLHLELGSVGANFQDHVRVNVIYRTNRISPGSLRHWVPGFFRYLVSRDGVMASNCCESGAFLCSQPLLDFPDIELVTHFQTFGSGGEVDIEVSLVNPMSRGRVFLNAHDPFGPPMVDAGFLTEETDVNALQFAIRRVQSIASRPALRDFSLIKASSPAAKACDGDALRKAIFETSTTAYHPGGSCSMGRVGEGALRADLKVHGMENLWVADASAMPRVPSGNIASAVIVLAEKASDLILGFEAQPIQEPPDS